MKLEIPIESYGIAFSSKVESKTDEKIEELKLNGFCVLDSGYSSGYLKKISDAFESLKHIYDQKYKKYDLKKIDEHNSLRLPLVFGGKNIFKALAFNAPLLELISRTIRGKFILNQQNGIINPSRQKYNQGKWHRDLPYQHYVSSRPLALNALFCVDDFTDANGSTFVLQGSHKSENYPSKNYIHKNARQIIAKKGHFIVLDCMLYHAGGKNKTNHPRRAINHVYTIPFFKQQISIPKNLSGHILSEFEKEILGFSFLEPDTIDKYLQNRAKKN